MAARASALAVALASLAACVSKVACESSMDCAWAVIRASEVAWTMIDWAVDDDSAFAVPRTSTVGMGVEVMVGRGVGVGVGMRITV